jgi:hypothetical protein
MTVLPPNCTPLNQPPNLTPVSGLEKILRVLSVVQKFGVIAEYPELRKLSVNV